MNYSPALVSAVHELGGESTSPDLIYTYDASLVTPHGAILLRSGKESRRGEEMVHRDWYEQAGIPVVGQINAPGTVDGGDVMWLANDTMAIGRSLRTNTSGIEQLRVLLSSTSTSATTISVFDVPSPRGRRRVPASDEFRSPWCLTTWLSLSCPFCLRDCFACYKISKSN